MSLSSMLNQTVSVYRLTPTTGSKKEPSLITSLKALIVPMGANAAEISKLTFARAFTGYVMLGSNVQIGDYLQDASGFKYDVQGARDYAIGTQQFIELALQRQTQQGDI